MKRRVLSTIVIFTLSGALVAPAIAQQPTERTVADVKREATSMLGRVPSFLQMFPDNGLPGAWEEMKTLQLNPDTAIPPKYKELIGLAVAAQIPCTFCVYFHTEAARLGGASEQEIKEAIAMAAVTRHWSTVLNGSGIEFSDFRAETDQIMKYVSSKTDTAATE